MQFAMSDADNLPMDLVQVKRPGKDTITLQVSNYTSTPRADNENPALFVRAFIGKNFDKPLYQRFHPAPGATGHSRRSPTCSFAFKRDTATIMEVAEDYGLTPVAFWFVIMTAGFALSLYITFVRCWARITPNAADPARCDVTLGGPGREEQDHVSRRSSRNWPCAPAIISRAPWPIRPAPVPAAADEARASALPSGLET